MLVGLLIGLSFTVCFGSDHEEGHVCFRRIDTNQDEIATFEEFEKVYGNDPEKYKRMDLDQDGKLTHDEYEEFFLNSED